MQLKNILILILMVLLFTACEKRYEDGPCLSFVKAENRLSGIWNLTNLSVSGERAPDETLDTLAAFRIAFFMNSNKALFVSLSDTARTVMAESVVRYNEQFTELSFKAMAIEGYETSLLPLFRNCAALGDEHIWTITRLKKSESSIETEVGEGLYQLDLSLETDYPNL